MRELERSESGGWLQVVRIPLKKDLIVRLFLAKITSESWHGKNLGFFRRLLLQQYSDDGLFGALLSICSQGGHGKVSRNGYSFGGP